MRVQLSVIALVLGMSGCTSPDLPDPKTTIHWISTDDVAHSLTAQPALAVGFDIDDTVLFSSPCFYYGKMKYSPGSEDYLKEEHFWEETNGGCDRYSIPKQVARTLIALHQQRGDTLYFITGRPQTRNEKLSEILQQDFQLSAMNPVIFTSGPEKTAFLKAHGIKIYYGDSDSDITSAQAAGARGIRVMRAANSTNLPLPRNGALGEEVIIDSDH
ncbi:acid phosphatase (class B) [Pseudomonas duriflava]|uniref:Class B acid phosphatase n=1 Tax=Pseudomonas duriflava TaxID=459528 RepID=A0A562QDJ7_9PSED|nr:acid phosphatase AphA [Pseudomonas duriflava]TWI54821.1 acid phosphatase (class B) [Pseudomonas duriflava]